MSLDCVHHSLVFISFLFISISAQAQDAQGQHTILADTLEGKIYANYLVNGRDSVLHGEFSFYSTQPIEAIESTFKGTHFKGRYKEGKKHGFWEFSQRQLIPIGEYQLKDYAFQKLSEGLDFRVNGTFRDGAAHGKWTSVRQQVKDGRILDTLIFVQSEFKDGVPFGRVESTTHDQRMTGQLGEDGLLIGDWIFEDVSNGLSEHRVFLNGVLVEHYFETREDRVTLLYNGLDMTPSDDENWKELEATGIFFDIMDIAHRGNSYPRSNSLDINKRMTGSNRMMRESLKSLNGSDEADIWTILPGSEPIQHGKVRLRYYPYEDDEKLQIERSSELYEEIGKKCEKFFNDPIVEIGRYSYEDVAYYFEVLTIYCDQAGSLGGLVELLAGEEFEYINRTELFPFLQPEIAFPERIEFEFKDSVRFREFHFPMDIEHSNGLISVILEHLEVINEDLIRIQNDSEKILEKYKKESQLAESEVKLVEVKDQIIALFSKEIDADDYNAYHADLKERVISNVRNDFKRYGERSLDERAEQIGILVSCFNAYLDLFEAVKKIPLRIAQIEESYTRTLWNPYTFTYMDERVKERVYRAYEQHILPAILDDLRNNLNCSTVENKPGNFVELYNRMLKIRDQDTKQIERQLRRMTNLNEILELLDIQLAIN